MDFPRRSPRTALTRYLAVVSACVIAGSALYAVPAAASPSTPTASDAAQDASTSRQMEWLDRGIVAVRASETSVHVSWRLLGLDPADTAFTLERSTDDGPFTPLTEQPIVEATSFIDETADLGSSNTYRVRVAGSAIEPAPGDSFTLDADHAIEPAVRVPLREGGPIKFVWVGDLDGDGAYDYVVDRQTSPQSIEAYRSDGTFLWAVDLGRNSIDQNNIEGGSSTIDVGHNDGVTVYDLDSDGTAEVAIRIANGVTFGDGTVFEEHTDDVGQSMAILDGTTGALRAHAPVPGDYRSDGPMYARLGVGHLDGVSPSLVGFLKNRIGNSGGSGAGFNLMYLAWQFDGEALTQEWKFLRGDQDLPDGHNTRIIDVDGDGRDELGEIGFLLNGDGTLRYSLAPQDIIHGDRWYIADIDPSRPGLEGYGVQQDHPAKLLDYYYDAATGEIIWKHYSDRPLADAGRGMVADIDPRFPGMETWSNDGEVNYHESVPTGVYNAPTNSLTEPDTSKQPWPHLGVWWDGDPLRELFDNAPVPDNRDARLTKWDPANPTDRESVPRILTFGDFGAVTGAGNSVYPTLIADILGDWREEVVLPNAAFDELVIFTTDQATDTRLSTLAHNPAYRNGVTLKGYQQSNNVDYFLGHDMEEPPVPNIAYVDAPGAPEPDKERPSVTLIAPTSNTPLPELTISVDADDEGGLQKIVANVYRGSQLVKSTQTALNGVTSGSHTATVALPDGDYTLRFNAHDNAGNVSQTGTQAFTIDATRPSITLKSGPEFTTQTGAGYDMVSYKLHDAGKVDRVELNGVVKDLTDNTWSDVNHIAPGAFGAVTGTNTLTVFDLAGNAQTTTFSLN
ncbi:MULTISPECIES: Ig-like domain repeat protein [unclassified Pseudoclavibacter]|uniref:rhamnogalacturonan lyase family protein n=1 Tax=unclassified Pseudoclavibacter TaxID=2615177 RepID=UPI001BA63522|nr:Ig-like domain repeat protein [Pseudoclavibacter sp. Marseille-Q4354]MBS3179868.1 Ig-like domain repeat protein [Pseudoclavibacter sp. Marseille-Q4354]